MQVPHLNSQPTSLNMLTNKGESKYCGNTSFMSLPIQSTPTPLYQIPALEEPISPESTGGTSASFFQQATGDLIDQGVLTLSEMSEAIMQ